MLVITEFFRENIMKYLSRQTRVCRDKHTFFATKDVFVCVGGGGGGAGGVENRST